MFEKNHLEKLKKTKEFIVSEKIHFAAVKLC